MLSKPGRFINKILLDKYENTNFRTYKEPFIEKEEVKMILFQESNPSFQEASKLIAEHAKKSEDAVVIKAVKGKFGRKSFLIDAYVYHTKEDKESIEPKKKLRKRVKNNGKTRENRKKS